MKAHVKEIGSLGCGDTRLIPSNPADSCWDPSWENQCPHGSLQHTYSLLAAQAVCGAAGTRGGGEGVWWGQGVKALSSHCTLGFTRDVVSSYKTDVEKSGFPKHRYGGELLICKRIPKASITDDFQIYIVGSDLSPELHIHISYRYWTSRLPPACPSGTSNFAKSKNELLIFPPSTPNLISLPDPLSRLMESLCSQPGVLQAPSSVSFSSPTMYNKYRYHQLFIPRCLLSLCPALGSRAGDKQSCTPLTHINCLRPRDLTSSCCQVTFMNTYW